MRRRARSCRASAHQRQQREDAALAVVVGPHDEDQVLDRDDDDQRPEDQRQHAEDVGRASTAMRVRAVEALAQRVQRAGADVAVDDAERREDQNCLCASAGARSLLLVSYKNACQRVCYHRRASCEPPSPDRGPGDPRGRVHHSAIESPEPAGDFDRYYAIGSTRRPPLRRLPGRASDRHAARLQDRSRDCRADARRSASAWSCSISSATLIIVASLVWGWGIAAAAYFAWPIVVPVLGLFFNRIDAWSTAAAILAVAAGDATARCSSAGARDRRRVQALAARAHAAAGRAVARPAIARRAGGVRARPRRRSGARRSWMAGTNSVLQVLTFRGATGWQIESWSAAWSTSRRLADAAARERIVADRRDQRSGCRSRCFWRPRRSASGAAGAARASTASGPDGSRACRRCCCCRRCCRRSS